MLFRKEGYMSLLSLLTQSMTSQTSVNSLSQKTGISDKAIKMLLAAAIPLLIKSLTQNASSQSGALSLLGALTQHRSTKSLSDQIAEADEDDGDKIISHIFGDQKSDVLSQLSAQSGLSAGEVNTVLGNMAPALLSSLSAAKEDSAQNSAPSGGIGSLLGGILGGASEASSGGLLNAVLGGGGGILGSLLGGREADDDRDNDGTNLLGALLGIDNM